MGSLIGAKSPCPPSLRVQPCPELNAAFPLDTQHSLEPIDPCVMGCEDDNSWIILFSRITGVLWVSLAFFTTSKALLGQVFQTGHLFCAKTLTDTSRLTSKPAGDWHSFILFLIKLD